jgi:hypothetical protein
MLCFFTSLIDFDWIKDHLISGRVSLTFLKNPVGSDSDPNGSDEFIGSDRILPPLKRCDALMLSERLVKIQEELSVTFTLIISFSYCGN